MKWTGKRVFLADDHELMRAGLRGLLLEMLDIDVVGEAADGLDVVRGVSESRPDLVLLDIGMPGLNGFDVLERLRRQDPSPPVIMLSMHSSVEDVARAMAAGANGYLPKESAFDELSQALDAVFSGSEYLGKGIDAEQVRRTRGELARGGSRLTLLTSRQREILQLIAEGYGPSKIAQRLNVSVKTVESHRAQIMDRLDIRDLPGLIRFAVRANLIRD